MAVARMRTSLAAPFAVVIIVLANLIYAAPPALAQTTPLYRVSGVVVDDAGNPLADVTVAGWTTSPNGTHTSDKTQTLEDGSYALRLGAGKGALEAHHPKWGRSAHADLRIEGDAVQERLVIQAPPPRNAVVEGVIRNAEGHPIAGATVTLGQGCCYAYDAGGSSGAEPAAGDAAPEKMAIGSTRPVYDDGDHQRIVTGEDGRYAFKTYAGPRIVTASAKGYAQSTVEIDARSGETVRADVTLDKVPTESATLTGRVTDAKTGLPIRGAHVSVSNLEWGRYAWATTDETGRYTASTLPGWTQVSISYYGEPEPRVLPAEGETTPVSSDGDVATSIAIAPRPQGPQYYQFLHSVRLATGTNAIDAKLEPKPEPTVVLVGYVVDPDAKKGVPGAQVSVWNQDTGDWGSATTDKTGSYKLLVRPGHYTMNAWAERHLPGARTFVIEDGATAKRIDIEAPAGEQRYAPCEDCVYATDAKPGAAAEPASVRASTDQEASGFSKSDAASGATGSQYEGTGGGLPPYGEDVDAASPSDGQPAITARGVPGPALGLALVALGLVAAALRRRG